MDELVEKIEYWAMAKRIDKADSLFPQLGKMMEEVGEVAECVSKPHKLEDLKGEIGDVIITAIILSRQAGFNIEDCVSIAMEKIIDRKGKVVDGIFVKDRD